MSWKSTIAKKQTWKDSVMRSKPITPDDMKSEVLKLVMPEIKEKTSWKNTLSIVPKNGLDGKDGKSIKGPKGDKGDRGDVGPAGKDGESIVGPRGDAGKDGVNGSQILFLDKKPTDEGNDGDLVLINKTFEVFYKENGECIKKGTLLGKDGKNSFVGGLNGSNGLSAYEVAVKNGFVGTEQEWLDSLQGSGGGGGGTSRVVSTISSNQSLSAAASTDYIYFVQAGITVTMPTAVSNTNQYYIKAIGASASVNFFGGQTGDGSSTLSLLENDSVTLISDGTNWRII